MKKKIKKILKKLYYGKFFSSETYVDYLRKNGAKIGEGTFFYSPKETKIDETSLKWLEIGENVQITAEVEILLHDYSYSILANKYNILPEIKSDTIIGNNVFIGHRALILPGTKIGNNVIIGASSVVSGNIDSDSVYAGNPARKIRLLSEHNELMKKRFPKAAFNFAKKYKTENGRWPTEFDMGIYRPLFTEYAGSKNNFESAKFIGVKPEVFENEMRFDRTYSTVLELVDEFMKGLEE